MSIEKDISRIRERVDFIETFLSEHTKPDKLPSVTFSIPGDKPTEQPKGWWCPRCQIEVSANQLAPSTLEPSRQFHDDYQGGCGAYVEYREPAPENDTPALLKVRCREHRIVGCLECLDAWGKAGVLIEPDTPAEGELKLCPHCHASAFPTHHWYSETQYNHVVRCRGCGDRGPHRDTEAEATSAWNRRDDTRLKAAESERDELRNTVARCTEAESDLIKELRLKLGCVKAQKNIVANEANKAQAKIKDIRELIYDQYATEAKRAQNIRNYFNDVIDAPQTPEVSDD